MSITVLYEDETCVVCIKPPDMDCEHELPTALSVQLGGTESDYYCVHRLDFVVGGVMVYARTKQAAAALSEQIQNHVFVKEYMAVVSGAPTPSEGTMENYLYKDAKKGRAFPVKSLRKGVKEAKLVYTTLAIDSFDEQIVALVRVHLHTGRYHQIRVQFASRKMPLLGDGKYGSREKRCSVALYSCKIQFVHPTKKEPMTFESMPPATFPWNCFAI